MTAAGEQRAHDESLRAAAAAAAVAAASASESGDYSAGPTRVARVPEKLSAVEAALDHLGEARDRLNLAGSELPPWLVELLVALVDIVRGVLYSRGGSPEA